MFEPEHCMMIGMFWSVALFRAMMASEGCDLLSKATISNFLPSAPPRLLIQSRMYLNCFRF